MNLELSRIDYYQVGTTTRKCLGVTKSQRDAKRDKVIVGDMSGIVQGLRLQKGNIAVSFRSLPSPKPITSLVARNASVYFSKGQQFSCITKKGKTVWNHTSNLTEDISKLSVDSGALWVAGKYSVSHYSEEGEELSFFSCPDRILDMTTSLHKNQGSILGCQDRTIRFIMDSEEYDHLEVEGPVTSLAHFENKTAFTRSLLYGTEFGQVGNFALDNDHKEQLWVLGNQKSFSIYGATASKNSAAITNITSSDFTGDGVDEIIVGRDDGSLEIYSFDITPEPTLIFSDNVEESISGLETGHIIGTEEDDIVLSTYSGKIMAFSSMGDEYEKELELSEKGMAKRLEAFKSKAKRNVSRGEKVSSLQKEIEKLKEKVDKEKEKHSKISQEKIAIHTQYNIKDMFVLDNSTASYKLTIELDIPIDNISIRSTIDVDLLTSEDSKAVISISDVDPSSKSKLIANFKCTEKTNRLSINIRTVEGTHGSLQIFVIPALAPKACRTKTYSVKPLSLHERVHDIDPADKPIGSLIITGKISINDGLGWMRLCLPDVPEKAQTEDQTLFFRSTFLNTILICKLSKNKISFHSDNLTTLSVLREFVTMEATTRKKTVDIEYDLNPKAYKHVLDLLQPKLHYQMSLSEKVSLIGALEEISQHEASVAHLSPEYQEILDTKHQLQTELKQQPKRLEFLYSVVIRLFQDKSKLKGNSAEEHIPTLRAALESFDMEKVYQLFLHDT